MVQTRSVSSPERCAASQTGGGSHRLLQSLARSRLRRSHCATSLASRGRWPCAEGDALIDVVAGCSYAWIAIRRLLEALINQPLVALATSITEPSWRAQSDLVTLLAHDAYATYRLLPRCAVCAGIQRVWPQCKRSFSAACSAGRRSVRGLYEPNEQDQRDRAPSTQCV
jgi:hypothetical protein